MNKLTEEDLKVLQTWNPDITMENLQELQQCLKTDAIYKAGLPIGITTAMFSYFIVPKRLGPMKSVIVATTSIMAYMFGRIIYGGALCQQKVFGPLNAIRRERKLQDSSSYFDGINQEDQQNVTPSDKLLEDDSSWTNFDSYLDSNVSHFDDTGSNFQEELPVEQPTNVKKDITYDDLWLQHRESQIKEQHSDVRGRRPIIREAPVTRQRTSEKSPPSKSAFDEETIWS